MIDARWLERLQEWQKEKFKDTSPFKVGAIKEFTVGEHTVYKQVVGLDDKGMPIWETMKGVGGPRFKEGEGEGGKDTALVKNMNYLKKTLNVSDKEAWDMLNEGKAKSRSAFVLDIYKQALNPMSGKTEAEARKASIEAGKMYDEMYGRKPEPTVAESKPVRGKITPQEKPKGWVYENGKLVQR